jgi:aspartyl protease family protein
MALLPSGGAAQPGGDCAMGREVTDDRGGAGTIVGGRDGLCLVKYQDGRTHSWVPADRLSAAPPKPAAPAAGANPPAPANAAPAPGEGTVILRPTIVNRLVYRADALGHVVLTADVNSNPVKFLVDTGATLVALTPEDAKGAGIDRGSLTFDKTVNTANGPVNAAFTRVRRIRIGQLEIEDVPAAVIDNLKQSVLGMSFLSRVKGFEMRDGLLTINW